MEKNYITESDALERLKNKDFMAVFLLFMMKNIGTSWPEEQSYNVKNKQVIKLV